MLGLNIVNAPLLFVVLGLVVIQLLFLLLRRPTKRWVLTVLIAAACGGGVAGAVWFVVVRTNNTFGVSPGRVCFFLFAATCASVGVALANLVRSSVRRKIVSGASVVLFLVAGTLGINATFGLDPTLGSLLGVTTESAIALPTSNGAAAGGPLYESWVAPSGRVPFQPGPVIT